MATIGYIINGVRRRVKKPQIGTAMALWILPIALVMRLTVFVRRRAASDFAAVDTSAAADLAVVGLSGLILLSLPRTRRVIRVMAGTSAMAILGFYGFCLVSSLWSSAPEYTGYRAIQVITQMGMAFLILSYFGSFARAERNVLLMASIIFLLDAVGRYKLGGGWAGMHTNSYSATASMLFCYCFGEFMRADRRRRRLLTITGVMALGGLIVGTCGSSNIGTVCGMAAAGVLRDSKMRGVMIVVIVAGVLLFATGADSMLEDAMYKYLLPGKTQESVTGMTGRMQIWEWALAKIEQKPFLGHGFAIATRASGKANSVHNTLLAILLDTGIVGLFIFVLASGRLLRETAVAARYRRPGVVGCWCAFVAAIVNCMGVPFLAVDWRPPTLVFSLFLGLHTLYILRAPPNGKRMLRPAPRLQPRPRIR